MDASWMQGDLDLKGNLATWNTGLKNWIHLPWHPPEDETDLNGPYTIRLVVEGKDGSKVEDRVQVEVGRAIAQVLPGIAVSPDKRVTMKFPEQALHSPFRVYTILPLDMVGEESTVSKSATEIVGKIYRVREPGDKFIKDVSLEFRMDRDELDRRSWQNVGVARYDAATSKWIPLDTAFNQEAMAFSTVLTELPEPKAIYALVHNPVLSLSHQTSEHDQLSGKPAPPLRPGVLVENRFEQTLGTVKRRDRFVGAALSLEKAGAADGSSVLRVRNENFGGNMAVTLLDTPFDIRAYPTMSFDYRVAPDVRTDIFLKVSGRWYCLRFTGEPTDFRNRDVNIANTGFIEGIVPDDRWHKTTVDLKSLLERHTGNTVVQEVVMASWRVSGYMKLEFGNNRRGATYYLDNFAIAGAGRIDTRPETIVVDDFGRKRQTNNLNEMTGVYNPPGWNVVSAKLERPAIASSSIGSLPSAGALRLDYDVTRPGAYGGYWTAISSIDLSAYPTVAFKTGCDASTPAMSVGIRNKHGLEGRTLLAPYASLAQCVSGWRDIRIPLSALRGLPVDATADVLFFSFSHDEKSGSGSFRLSDIRFEQAPATMVANFEHAAPWTLLGGDTGTFQNGAAVASGGSLSDTDSHGKAASKVLRISYGGSVGLDYGANGGFSYAGWRGGLGGIDARSFTSLTMRVRGEKGGEAPNIYLNDGVTRYPLRAKEIPAITKEWQTISLPLAYYGKHGLDLSRLDALEFVFEWTEQSGTVYLDDIAFTK